MWRFAVLIAAVFDVVSCSPGDPEATKKCATDIYPSYNPKVLEQCMDVCIKCDRGVMTTCSTSCTLKGARWDPASQRPAVSMKPQVNPAASVLVVIVGLTALAPRMQP
jgi:hypothetical protein